MERSSACWTSRLVAASATPRRASGCCARLSATRCSPPAKPAHFLRDAPLPFTVKGASHRNVRVLAFGDFGDGSERQTRMAEAMARFHAKTPFDFAVTLGDNFISPGWRAPQIDAGTATSSGTTRR